MIKYIKDSSKSAHNFDCRKCPGCERIGWNKAVKKIQTESLKNKGIKGCRHRNAWIINGGYGLWCYECGAYRQTMVVKGTNHVIPISKRWIKPTGIGGKNPSDKLVERKHD